MVSLHLFSSTPSLRSLRFWWPWLGLLTGLALTFSAWSQVSRAESARFEAFRHEQLASMVERVERRMNTLKVVLQGSASYLGRGALPSRAEWRAYVESLDLNATYPGIQGLGFAEWIPKAELGAHLQRVRGEGFPEYQIIPGGPLAPDPGGCSASVYLEPMDARNLRAFGKDMLAEPVRREAMLRARDTGLPTLSGKVVLYQEGDAAAQAGTLLFMPVYRQGWPLGSVAQRRAALRGWTYHPFRMGDLLRGTLSGDTHQAGFELFDGIKAEAEHLLFDSDPSRSVASHAGELVRSFDVAGRTWTAHVYPDVFYFGSAGRNHHLGLLISGVVASLLLFLLLVTMLGAEGRARLLADQRGEELLATESRFRALFEKAPFGMAIVATDSGRFLSVNPRLEEILGYSCAELLERGFQAVSHPDYLIADQASLQELKAGSIPQIRKEKRYLHKEGREIWGRVNIVMLPSASGTEARHLTILEDITEVRARGEELRASQARFQEIFDLSPDPITLSRQSDGALVMVNQAWCDLTGIPMEGAIGQTPSALGLWSDPVSRAALIAELEQVGYIAARPSLILHRDGSERHVLITGRLLSHRGEDLVLILGKDVTALQAIEANLRTALAESRQFREALDHVPTHVYIKDLDSRYLYACQKTLDLFGVSREELVGCDDARFFPPEVVTRLRTIDARVFSGEETQEEIVVTSDQGERQVFWDVKSPIYADLERTRISGLLGISMDITEQKRVEAILGESEARFRTLAETAPVLIWMTDAQGQCIHFNQAWTDWTGLPLDQALGEGWLACIHTEDREACREAYRRAFDARQPFATEFRLRHRSGGHRWISDRGTPRFAADGTFLGCIGAGIDIQDMRDAEAAIRESELRVHKAESLVLMAGGIAHDFNNLFQSILGYLEIATLKAGEEAGVASILGKAGVSLQKAIGLSWKMLDFSGRSFIRPERMDLEGWLPAYLATLALECPPAFHLDVSCAEVPSILGDSAKLEEVLKALLDNAREALGPVGGRVSVRLFTDFGEDHTGAEAPGIWRLPRPDGPATVCLEVSDSGPGVPPVQLNLICDPFYTTKETGRGLGLAAVVGILTAHRAGLHLMSGKGELNGQGGGLSLRMHFPPS